METPKTKEINPNQTLNEKTNIKKEEKFSLIYQAGIRGLFQAKASRHGQPSPCS